MEKDNSIDDVNISFEDEYEEYTVDVEEIYKEEQEEKMTEKKKGKKRFKRKVALLIFEILVTAMMSFVIAMLIIPNSKIWLLKTPIGKFIIQVVMPESDVNNIIDKNFVAPEANKGLDISAMEGYTNIALFGVDSRSNGMESWANSDTIIIASIHNETGKVKLCSVYRDTILRIAKDNDEMNYNKINSGYESLNGPANMVKSLNYNLDLNISDYVTVNFSGLANIIDMLGGIDINISSEEMYWINQYLTETRKITGMYAPDVTQYGYVHLSGLQATAFCRIRVVTFTDEDGQKYGADMGRTARQRRIIQKMVDLAKNAGVSKIMDIADEVFHGSQKLVYTSMSYGEIVDLIPTLLGFSIEATSGYPYTYQTAENIGSCPVKWPIAVAGLSYNNYKLHEFLFDDKKYKASETVKNIDDYLAVMFGVPEQRVEGDESLVVK